MDSLQPIFAVTGRGLARSNENKNAITNQVNQHQHTNDQVQLIKYPISETSSSNLQALVEMLTKCNSSCSSLIINLHQLLIVSYYQKIILMALNSAHPEIIGLYLKKKWNFK